MDVTLLAQLAMDCYRRPEIGSDVLNVPGNATWDDDFIPVSNDGFSAAVYHVGTEIVLAFRGTDDPVQDIPSGWGVGLGWVDATTQIQQAFDFYYRVKAEFPNANITLTGHSLGGGLAGVVASALGLAAYVFDSLPFSEAAEYIHMMASAYELYPPNATAIFWHDTAYNGGSIPPIHSSAIGSTHVEGEVAHLTLGGIAGSHELSVPTNTQFTSPIPGYDAHDMALLNILLEAPTSSTAWNSAGGFVVTALYNDTAADIAGYTNNDPHFGPGGLSEVMRRAIAYTNSEDVGDGNVAALFDDARDLGDAFLLSGNALLTRVAAEVAVIYAGGLALASAGAGPDGVLDFEETYLSLFFDSATWAELSPQVRLDTLRHATDAVFDLAGITADEISNEQSIDRIVILASQTAFHGILPANPNSTTLFIGTGLGDHITGGQEADIIFAGNSSLNTSVGSVLVGGAGYDQLIGSRQGDIILGGADGDFIDGGDGRDTLSYQDATVGINFNDLQSYLNTGDAAGDSFKDIEIFEGSNLNDHFTINQNLAEVRGGGGDDLIVFNGMLGMLIGGEGADKIRGGGGGDRIFGDDQAGQALLVGEDFLIGGAGADEVNGGGGNDLIIGGSIAGDLDLALETKTSYLSGVNFSVNHAEWDDGARDDLLGGVGNDTYLSSTSAWFERNQFYNASLIQAMSSADFISDSDSTFTASFQITRRGYLCDTFTITGSQIANAQIVDGIYQFGNVDILFYEGDEFIPEEWVEVPIFGRLVTSGGIEALLIMTSDGYRHECVVGGILGLNLDPDKALDVADLMFGTDNVSAARSNDNAFAAENAGNDVLYVGNGNDSVFALGGDDTIIAGHGQGYDYYDGGDGSDTLTYTSTSAGIVVDLASGSASGIEIDADTFTSIENVVGGSGNDTITGNSDDNLLNGGAGNDILDGLGGADLLIGGSGQDVYTYSRGSGEDTIQEDAGEGNGDQLVLSGIAPGAVSFTQSGNDVILTIADTTPGAGDGSSILLKDQLRADGDYGVETVTDGAATTWTKAQIIALSGGAPNNAPSITSDGGMATAAVNVAENLSAVTTVVATDQDTGTTITYSIAGGTDATKFAINGSTGVLTFIAAPNFEAPTDVGANNVYDVIVQASDGTLTDNQAIAVTVTNVNEAPIIGSNGGGATAAVSINENTAAVTSVTSTDVDAGSTKVFSISGGADAAKFAINSSTGALTFVATPDFETPTDVGANNVYDVIVQASDGTLTDTQAIAVTVTNVNEAPIITSNGGGASATISINENTTAVTSVTSTDVDAGSPKVFSIGGGADAAKFAINASTGVLTFVAAPDFETPTDTGANNTYDVVIQVSDGTLTDTQALAVTVADVSEAPVITSNGGAATAAISLIENSTTVTTVSSSGGVGRTYSISGGADAAKFAINATSGVLTFVAAPNFEAAADAGANNVYDVIVTVADGALTDTQAIAVSVTNTNEAPLISSNGGGATATISLAENGTAVTTVTSTDPDAGATKSFSIAGGADAAKFAINATTGALTFVSAPNFEAPTDAGGNNVYDVVVQVSDGTLTDTQAIAVMLTNANEAPVIGSNGGGATASVTVSSGITAVTTATATDVDAGTTIAFSISGGADASKFAINGATGVLTFVTAPNFAAPTDAGANNVYDVIVRASDGTLADTQAIAVTVAANSAPTITSNGGGATAAIGVAENATAVTTVTSTDPDAGASKTYSISGGADAAKFAINSSTGVLTFVSAPNFEAPTDAGTNNVYDVIVRVSDGSLVDTQAIAVTVTNTNEAPVIGSNGGGATATIGVNENGTAVTTVTSTDPDAGATKTFSISGGADAAKFAINATTGVLTFASAPNFEAPTDVGANNVYDVVVQVSDGTLTDTQAIGVTVSNVNEAPVITSNGGGSTAAISLAENVTAVTTVAATDPDAGAAKTFSISGGTDAAKFAINATTGLLTFVNAPNFEAPTDVGGNNVYDVIVQVSDGALIDSQALAVSVTNVNEAPVISSNGGGANAAISTNENTTSVSIVTSTDQDVGATKIFAISGGADAAKFAINASTGVLSFIAAPDFETPADVGANNVYDVIVQVSDGSLVDTQALAVTVINANEAPVITSNGGGSTASISINENSTAVTTVTSTDPDAGAAKTFSISGGADAARFAINATTGVLTFVSGPNFEAPTDAGSNNVYDIIVNVSDGSLTDTQAVAVTVVDVAEGGGPITGTSGNDTLTGTSAGETLSGLAGNDTLNAGAGDDILIGGSGADALNGGDGFDIASYSTATSGVYIHTGNSSANTGDAAGDVATGIEGLIGSGFADEIILVEDSVKVWGGAGNDSLTLAGLNTTAYGEDGDDAIYGGASADMFYGGAGEDTIFGYMGDDVLDGGSDNDWLVGGAGNDTFVFGAMSGEDGIADFEAHGGTVSGDVVELHGQSATSFAALMANATEWAGTSYINLDNGQNITLHGVTLSELSSTDFRFV